MISSKVLGQRIRFFRKRAGISQFDLELAIDASPGMLSRIESGKVNPTKETVQKIGNELNLTHRELDYLVGISSSMANEDEINIVLEEVKDFMDRKDVLAYLLDRRWRFVYMSRGFSRLMKEYSIDSNKLLNKSVINVLVDNSLGVRGMFEQKDFEELLYSQMAYYYAETNFMFDDPVFQETNKVIEEDKVAYKIWNLVMENHNNNKAMPPREKAVRFKVNGLYVPMTYSREPLINNIRFEIVEYQVKNKLLKMLMKAI